MPFLKRRTQFKPHEMGNAGESAATTNTFSSPLSVLKLLIVRAAFLLGSAVYIPAIDILPVSTVQQCLYKRNHYSQQILDSFKRCSSSQPVVLERTFLNHRRGETEVN